MKELNDILSNQQKARQSFCVPEGYFDSLADRVMSQIPGDKLSAEPSEAGSKKKATVIPLFQRKTWRWAAACACVIIIGVTTVFQFNSKHLAEETALTSQPSVLTDDAINQAADYTMLDNQDIYLLLAEE